MTIANLSFTMPGANNVRSCESVGESQTCIPGQSIRVECGAFGGMLSPGYVEFPWRNRLKADCIHLLQQCGGSCVRSLIRCFSQHTLMKARIPIIAILCCLFTSGAIHAGNASTRILNVKDYGAVGDDKTDNTAAFSKCLDALIETGGGRMLIPDGIYRGRIIIPGNKEWITVEIVGDSEPTPVFGTIGSFPFPANGTVIKCVEQSGAAVISASDKPQALYMSFSGVHVSLKNLDVRTYNDPAISGIDLAHAAQCKIENVFVNTDRYNVQASKPTHGTSGIITPACNNAALTILRNVVVTGYHTGILVNEHADGDNINLASNINGLEFAFAHHASRFGRVGAQRCTRSLAVTGKHGFTIEQLDTEIAGARQTDENNIWQATDFNLYDPENLGTGEVRYWVVEGNVGAVEKFTRKGAAAIQARRIGSSQEPVR